TYLVAPTTLSEALKYGMRNTRVLYAGIVAAFVVVELSAQAPAAPKPAYRAPRTGWGQPDIHGDYTNKDEANTPLERPRQLAGKDLKDFTDTELTQLARKRSDAARQFAAVIGGAETGAGPTHWYDNLAAK